MTDLLTSWIESIVTFPVFLPFIVLLTFLDAVLPAIPSEPVLSVASAWSGATGQPNIWAIFLLTFLGTLLGDHTCYVVGRRFQRVISRRRASSRMGRAIAWIKRMMKAYGGAAIIIARFIPYARWTLTITLGSMRYNWWLFFLYDTIGILVWTSTTIGVGYLGGYLLQSSPLLGVVVGAVAGTTVGLSIQKMQAAILRWSEERRGVSKA